MRLFCALSLTGLLAACGTDGLPTHPGAKPGTPTGMSISGEARVGVVGGL